MQIETDCLKTRYDQTGYFSKIVTDYLQAADQLKNFYQFDPTLQGIDRAITERKKHKINRRVLNQYFKELYQHIQLSPLQTQNIEALLSENTFTVCTAHQPNLLGGPLYFIYKIVHAIQLAQQLNQQHTHLYFVPVFFMGSEDADIDELGHFTIQGKTYRWNTQQTGAVGRMKIDAAFMKLIDEMESQLLIEPNGAALMQLIKEAYVLERTIQDATLHLIQSLFASWGLLVLIPDHPLLKQQFIPILKKEVSSQFSHQSVSKTIQQLQANYKIQVEGRDLNLFYLWDDRRERIEKDDEGNFIIHNTTLKFSSESLLEEIELHPEKFSPNVILRGVFQEMILPNVAFIGGGGEIAYWLELKTVFEAANVPFPVLLLRNSFLLMQEKHYKKWQNLNLSSDFLFKDEISILNKIVEQQTTSITQLATPIQNIKEQYSTISTIVGDVDVTLSTHTKALSHQAIKKLKQLEKKVMRAERRKFIEEKNVVEQIKKHYFPNNGLQERVENFSSFYAKMGKAFIEAILKNSESIPQHFTTLVYTSN